MRRTRTRAIRVDAPRRRIGADRSDIRTQAGRGGPGGVRRWRPARRLLRSARVASEERGPLSAQPRPLLIGDPWPPESRLDPVQQQARGHARSRRLPGRHGGVRGVRPQQPESGAERAPHLDAAAVTYAVGGMATHWTCASPRHHPTIERTGLISADGMGRAVRRGGAAPRRDTGVLLVSHCATRSSGRCWRQEYRELEEPYQVQALPLAVRRREDDPQYVRWSGTDTVLGPLAYDDHDRPLRPSRRAHLPKTGDERRRADRLCRGRGSRQLAST